MIKKNKKTKNKQVELKAESDLNQSSDKKINFNLSLNIKNNIPVKEESIEINIGQISPKRTLNLEIGKKPKTEEKPERLGLFGNPGPITRRKEIQIQQFITNKSPSNTNINNDKSILLQFDEMYKDNKNVENELYYYRPPRISEKYQAKIDDQNEINNINCQNLLPRKNNYFLEKKIDLNKISNDDMEYFIKFINYFSNDYNSNPLIKGKISEDNALDLLKECNYDINLCISKILFPSLEIDEELFNHENNKEKIMFFVNSALNNLIGSNIYDKEQWLEHVNNRISKKIEYSELYSLLELANKMKIDIPKNISGEIKRSQDFSNLIRQQLNERNSLEELKKILKETDNYNVKTEEFIMLNEIIKKAKVWMKKASEIKNKNVNYKVLQNLYNEGKNLPVKLVHFDEIKNRYLTAHQWQEKFLALPKHSKTRQQGPPGERCNLTILSNLLQEAESINFSSPDVISLKINLEGLRDLENRINMILEDNSINKTKEILGELINSLDDLKFTTNLYDYLMNKYEFFEWVEKKNYYLKNKLLKIKHLRNLIKEANQRNLNLLPEIRAFRQEFEQIDNWLEIMSSIFYKENCPIINIEELDIYYKEGKEFILKPEEIEHLLTKCEEVYDFINECKSALNSQSYDYQKLSNYRDQIQKYNIKCDVFLAIDSQINLVQNWIKSCNIFIDNRKKLEPFKFEKLTSLEIRQKTVDMLEKFSNFNLLFFENLNDLLNKVTTFAKFSKEFNELIKIKKDAENFMNNNKNLEEVNLSELENLIEKSHYYSISKSFFSNLLCFYRAKSWNYIVSFENKMTINQAELMLQEGSNNNFSSVNIEIIRENINKTKEWTKQIKKSANEKLNYFYLKTLIKDGTNLPLHTPELEQLFNFQALLENDIFYARTLLQSKIQFKELNDFSSKISDYYIEVPEFEVLKNLLNVSINWKLIASKIIQSRKVCDLFFKSNKTNYVNLIKKSTQSCTNLPNKEESILSSIIKDEENSKFNNKSDTSLLKKKKNKIVTKSQPVSENNLKIFENENGDFKKKKKKWENYTNDNTKKKNLVNNFDDKLKKTEDEIIENLRISEIKKKKSKKKEYQNVLNIINNNSNKKQYSSFKITNGKSRVKNKQNINISNPNYQVSNVNNNGKNENNGYFEKINIKKFNNLSYEERLVYLEKNIVLKMEDASEKYCICRRGDDTINYMLMCEICKEWFHGSCLKIIKANADKISQYICLTCSRRKDNYIGNYHHEFLNYKRISWYPFLDFLEEGEKIPLMLDEIESLKDVHYKVHKWIEKASNCIRGIKINKFLVVLNNVEKLDKQKLKFGILDENLEKLISNLYLESEGYQVEVELSYTLILVLKHHDWFKESSKSLEKKKFSMKNSKKLLGNSLSLFQKDNLLLQEHSDIEREYIEKACREGKRCHVEILEIYEKYETFVNIIEEIKNENNIEEIEEIVRQIDLYDIPAKKVEQLTDEIKKYENWKELTKTSIAKPSITFEHLSLLNSQGKLFPFRTIFLEKFNSIVQNYKKENTDYYLYLLNENKNGRIILNNTENSIQNHNNFTSTNQIIEKQIEQDK